MEQLTITKFIDETRPNRDQKLSQTLGLIKYHEQELIKQKEEIKKTQLVLNDLFEKLHKLI